MSADHKYNGWANYETWSVNLIISNDQGLDEEARTLARYAADHEEDPGLKRVRAADDLKEWVGEAIDQEFELGTSSDWKMLAQQLISGALSDVDWLEIADANLEES